MLWNDLVFLIQNSLNFFQVVAASDHCCGHFGYKRKARECTS